jgi:peptide/nickel transport system substrate-binding protein
MPPEISRREFLLTSSLAVAGLMIGCSAPPRKGGVDEITWALPNIGDSLFVPRAWSTYTGAIASLVQEGLLSFADDLSLTTAAAESWQQISPTTLTYTLREGVTFGDGSRLTADDVVASYRYHMDPAAGSQLAAFFSPVASVEATDEGTITINLKAPDVQFRFTPAHMAGFVFRKSQLERSSADLGNPENLPLGTGPYKLAEFIPADRVVLEARDDYWGVKPVARRIVFREIPDPQTRLLAMRGGDIDGTFDLALSDVEQWRQLGNADVTTAPSLGVVLLTLDQSARPFKDIHVRRAIAHSVDRVGLVQALLKGNGEPAVALDPPEIWAGVLPAEDARAFYSTIPQYEFDLQKARAELALSAHPQGFAITVPGSTADPYQVNILQSVAANLQQIGIRMTVQEKDGTQWLADYFRHEDLGMQIMTYLPDFPDPANYPTLFLSSANATVDGLNASNFRNADVDAALGIANGRAEPALRAEALKTVLRIASTEVAIVPIFWQRSAMAINKSYRLDGYNAFWYNVPWATRGFGLR